MASSSFVHLHLHTQYSLLDGAIKLPNLFRMAKHYEMPAVAMTDHGNLFGAIDFYEHAKEAGVKPIIGCEIYYTPGSRKEKNIEIIRAGARRLYHLTLLAKDREGYLNLCKMITDSYLEGFYYKPRVDRELLEKYNGGLICLSGCLASEVSNLVLSGNEKNVRERIEWYKQVFDGRYYLEIQENEIPDQKRVNKGLIDLSKQFELPLVATNDVHYLSREDASAQDVLICIQTGKTVSDPDRLRIGTDELYFKSPEVIRKQFAYAPEACDNTLNIADQCNVEFSFGRYFLPKFEIPEKEKSLDEYLRELAFRGFEEILSTMRERGENPNEQEYQDRLQYELKIITEMGFSGYILIVWDFIRFAKQKGIPVGPGRGSSAGSLVCYALKITDVDPIVDNLLFERFLNPERISMPDIDVDFCMDRRGEVIDYVSKKYGYDKVAQIITFGKMQARAAIRDAGRALDIPYGEVDKIAKLVPSVLNITLEKALEQEPRLAELVESDGRIRHLIKMAKSLEGLYRHASIHAAGIVISEKPMVEYLPLFRGKEGEVVTQFDMKKLEKIGLIKFDFLGLTTLTVIRHATDLIHATKDPSFDISKIPYDDSQVFELLSKANTLGVFQLESSGMRDLLSRLKPTCFEDITAVNALYRPGPLGSGMVDEFIDRKHGRVSIKYELPQLEEVLKETYGVIVYQEQVMKIANILANYSMGEADLLRRAMGKKIHSEMKRQKQRFLDGSAKNGIPVYKGEKIFDLIAKFAEYGFPKSHSTAYAIVAYQTAYLKAHYPAEFMAALLTSEVDNTDKITAYIQDARSNGLEILPPDVNESEWRFTVVDERIRAGLGVIKGVGEAAIEAIIEARDKEGPFQNLFDFCNRVNLKKVNKKVLEVLIQSGAFDATGNHRAQLFAVLERAVDQAQTMQMDIETGQTNMFASLSAPSKVEGEEIKFPDVPEWPLKQRLAKEKGVLGFYITGHPLEPIKEKIALCSTVDTSTIRDKSSKSEVVIGGIVNQMKETLTRRGDRMAFVTFEDLKGTVEVIVFSDLFIKSAALLTSEEPLLIKGTAENSEESVKIIASDIQLLAQAHQQEAKEVHINVSSRVISQEDLLYLKHILNRHRGSCQAFLHFRGRQSGKTTVMELGDSLRLAPTEQLVKEVEEVLGPNVVRFS
ncbi:DNA polymerase III subunit alpha [Bdellovibrionota bacterium]